MTALISILQILGLLVLVLIGLGVAAHLTQRARATRHDNREQSDGSDEAA